MAEPGEAVVEDVAQFVGGFFRDMDDFAQVAGLYRAGPYKGGEPEPLMEEDFDSKKDLEDPKGAGKAGNGNRKGKGKAENHDKQPIALAV